MKPETPTQLRQPQARPSSATPAEGLDVRDPEQAIAVLYGLCAALQLTAQQHMMLMQARDTLTGTVAAYRKFIADQREKEDATKTASE